MTDDPLAADAADQWLQVGRVAGPLGIRGELKVDLDTDFPERFERLSTIYVGEDHCPMAVAGARVQGGRVILRLVEITDRGASETLRGAILSVPGSEAVPLPDGHYYQHQIVGLRVWTTDGQDLGTVVEILSTGNNDVYVAREGVREVLIPAIHDVVRQIDLASGRLVVEAIEGLL
jgi:16S rRNA processing protein RimM